MTDEKKKGVIFDIQRWSLHDGPGIRTNVFFKGCPLSCQWCSNPESQEFCREPALFGDKCIHCLSCVEHCPHGAIHTSDHGSGWIMRYAEDGAAEEQSRRTLFAVRRHVMHRRSRLWERL